jgi:hypothetical protein
MSQEEHYHIYEIVNSDYLKLEFSYCWRFQSYHDASIVLRWKKASSYVSKNNRKYKLIYCQQKCCDIAFSYYKWCLATCKKCKKLIITTTNGLMGVRRTQHLCLTRTCSFNMY